MAKTTIDQLIEYSVDEDRREIYLSSVATDSEGNEQGVDTFMAEYFVKGIRFLSKTRGNIRVLMNNIGGDWFHGMAIYDAILACPRHVDIEVFGHAMSMGAVILQAGRKRIMHPNSAIMVHDGYEDFGSRPVQSARNWSNYEETLRARMYEIFSVRSGRPPSYWKKKSSHDYILGAVQAVEQGLADSVYVPPKIKDYAIKKPRAKRSRH